MDRTHFRQLAEELREDHAAREAAAERARQISYAWDQFTRVGSTVYGYVVSEPRDQSYSEWEAVIRDYAVRARQVGRIDRLRDIVDRAADSEDRRMVCAAEIMRLGLEEAPEGEIASYLMLAWDCQFLGSLRARLEDLVELVQQRSYDEQYGAADTAVLSDEAFGPIVDPITIDQMAVLVMKDPKTLHNAKTKHALPGPVVRSGRSNVYSYAAVRPWLLEKWPDTAGRVPVSYGDARKLFLASDATVQPGSDA